MDLTATKSIAGRHKYKSVDSNNNRNPIEDQETSSSVCLNCGAELLGKFCAECGQSTLTSRYSYRAFVNEIYIKFRSIDALATLRTFHALSVRPGEFVQAYLAGKRVGFTNPITYFFYYFVVEVFVLAFLQWATGNPGYGKQGTVGLEVQVVTLITTIFWGLLWWVFFRRSNLNLVENAIAAIYFVAQVNIFSLIFLIAVTPFAKRYPAVKDLIYAIEAVLYFGYGIAFCRKLSRDPLWLLLPKQLLLSVLFLVITILVFAADFLGGVLITGTTS